MSMQPQMMTGDDTDTPETPEQVKARYSDAFMFAVSLARRVGVTPDSTNLKAIVKMTADIFAETDPDEDDDDDADDQ